MKKAVAAIAILAVVGGGIAALGVYLLGPGGTPRRFVVAGASIAGLLVLVLGLDLAYSSPYRRGRIACLLAILLVLLSTLFRQTASGGAVSTPVVRVMQIGAIFLLGIAFLPRVRSGHAQG
jgi:hypothetical protein